MSYDFNGTTQYLMNDVWTGATDYPYTFCAWMYPDGQAADTVVALAKSTGTGSGITTLSPRATGADGANLAAGAFAPGYSYSQSLSGTAYSAGAWVHGCAVHSSATSRLIYHNGVAGTTNTGNVVLSSIDRLLIGATKQGTSAAADFFDGKVAEVGVWNVALTGAEAASLAKGFKPPRIRPQSLLFYAPLIRDLRDFRRALTLTNVNTAVADVHARVI